MTPLPKNDGRLPVFFDASGARRSRLVVCCLAMMLSVAVAGGWYLLSLQPISTDRAYANAFTTTAAQNTPARAITAGLLWVYYVTLAMSAMRVIILAMLAAAKRRLATSAVSLSDSRLVAVTVLIPAFNEAQVIGNTIRRVLDSRSVAVDVVVIDDGSTDQTADIVAVSFGDHPRVRLLRLENGGKAQALNTGLGRVSSDVVIAMDADTQFDNDAIARLLEWFDDEQLGAVAGNAKVGNRVNFLTNAQAIEYVTAQNLERRALARLNAITVVPGAIGAWRRQALTTVGGYPDDTLAEDQDLTIAIQRAGWMVRYDPDAIAWTEAPERLSQLVKQRSRWAFGTFQCVWKHRTAIGRLKHPGMGLVGLPHTIVSQFFLAALSPVIDLVALVALLQVITGHALLGHHLPLNSPAPVLIGWLAYALIDLMSGVIACRLDGGRDWSLLWYLLPQRIFFRSLAYYLIGKATLQALAGSPVGWGKLYRSGRVETHL